MGHGGKRKRKGNTKKDERGGKEVNASEGTENKERGRWRIQVLA